MHPKKAEFVKKLEGILPSSDLQNSYLIQKGFQDWSLNYLEKNSFFNYVNKIDNYFRLIEVITIDEIQNSLNYSGLEKVRVLLDGFQLSLEKSEQKLFGVENLSIRYYSYNQFLYSIMLMFFELDSAKEIDKRITLLTQWLEDVSYSADKFYRQNRKLFDAVALQDLNP